MSRRRDLVAIAGDSLSLNVTAKDLDDDVIDLTGLTSTDITFKLYTRKGGSAVVTRSIGSGLTIVSATEGTLTVETLQTETEDLTPGLYWYELAVLKSSTTFVPLRGVISIERRAGSPIKNPQPGPGGGGIGTAATPLASAGGGGPVE